MNKFSSIRFEDSDEGAREDVCVCERGLCVYARCNGRNESRTSTILGGQHLDFGCLLRVLTVDPLHRWRKHHTDGTSLATQCLSETGQRCAMIPLRRMDRSHAEHGRLLAPTRARVGSDSASGRVGRTVRKLRKGASEAALCASETIAVSNRALTRMRPQGSRQGWQRVMQDR